MATKKEQKNVALNDASWRSFIFTIFLDSDEAHDIKLQHLGDWISGGYRQKFARVTRQMAIENAKLKEVCKELKSAVESGTAESDLSPTIIAKATKAYLLDQKQFNLDGKVIKPNSEVLAVEEKKKDTGKKGTLPLKAIPKTEAISTDALDGTKKKEKLRNRTGTPPGVGDEPVDGPNTYYYLQDFNDPELVISISEELGQSFDMIIKVAINSEEQKNSGWKILKEKSLNLPEIWRRAVWVDMKYSDLKDTKECFENISKKIYTILENEKTYLSFYKNDKVIGFPGIISEKVDTRYYKYLMESANCNGLAVIEPTLALFLEAVVKSAENADVLNPKVDSLKIDFDREFQRFLADPGVMPDRPSSMSLFERSDTLALNSLYLQSLKSLGIDPAEISNRISACCSASKYANFFERLPEQGPYSLAYLAAESVKLKTEFLRNTLSMEQSSRFQLHVLCLLEFERAFIKDSTAAFSFDEWRWFGAVSTNSILQLIEKAKVFHPDISSKYSSVLGSLMVILKSPGPIGCFEYQTTRNIHVRTKPGFGLFNELYESASESADKEKSSFKTPSTSYEMHDRLVTVQINEIFMYPANGIIIKAVETNEPKSKVMNTTISWLDNTFLFHGYEQGKTKSDAAFSANFCNGETLFLYKSKLALSGNLKFSDSNGNHYNFTNEGYIIIDFYAKARSLTEEKEIRRVIMPTGTVIRHFSSAATEVLFPDGSTARRPKKDSEWVKTNGSSGLSYSVETRPSKNEIELSREDFVSILSGKGYLLAEHACGISMKCENDQKILIKSPGMGSIVFESNGKQIITLSHSFTVERTMVKGLSMEYKVYKNDVQIDIDSKYQLVVKMGDFGFTEPLPKGRNEIKIQLLEGSMNLKDICGMEFSLSKDFKTTISKPETLTYPEISFGGKSTRAALKNKSTNSFFGNCPILFKISGNGEENFQIRRDLDLLNSFKMEDDRENLIEETDTYDDCLQLSTTKFVKISEIDQKVVLYSMDTRYNPPAKDLKSNAVQSLNDIEKLVIERNATVSLKDLGETEDSLKPALPVTKEFIHGSSKELTKLKIALLKLEKQELLLHSKPSMVTQKSQQIAGRLKSTRNDFRKEMKHRSKIELQEIPKYFDSPEGGEFLARDKISAPLLSVEINANSEEALNESSPGIDFAESAAVLTEIRDPESAAAVIEKAEAEILPLSNIKSLKKERKLRLPTAIYGKKPGVIPNTKNMQAESTSRRPLNTSSTAKWKKNDVNYGITGFVVYPSKCNFGNVKQNETPTVSIDLKNVGIEPARFVVKLPKISPIQVSFKHGLLAPGMSVKLNVKLRTGNIPSSVNEVMKVVSETEILTIPILANIL